MFNQQSHWRYCRKCYEAVHMYVGGVNAKLQPCTSNLHVSVAAFNLVCVVGIHLAFGQITYKCVDTWCFNPCNPLIDQQITCHTFILTLQTPLFILYLVCVTFCVIVLSRPILFNIFHIKTNFIQFLYFQAPSYLKVSFVYTLWWTLFAKLVR